MKVGNLSFAILLNVINLTASAGLIASHNPFLAYLTIYVATIFLGNISAFAGFWLIFQGYLGSWGVPLLILVIFLADLSGDLLWYTLGRTLRKTRLGGWIKNHTPGYQKAEFVVEKNGRHLLFFSKFIYAAAFPVIFSLGWTKMEFKKFFKNSVLSILIWLPILLGLAYGIVSGLWPLRTVSLLKDFELVFLLGLALFLVCNYLLARALGKFIDWRMKRSENFDRYEENSYNQETLVSVSEKQKQ